MAIEQSRPTPRRVKGSGNGKDRSRKPTPQQLERQERAYELSVVYGLTIRQIAKALEVAHDTVIRDIREEAKRREAELGERREAEKARAVSFYQAVARKAINIAEKGTLPGDTARLSDAIKARERIDRVLGIDAPVKIEGALAILAETLAEDDDRDRALTE